MKIPPGFTPRLRMISLSGPSSAGCTEATFNGGMMITIAFRSVVYSLSSSPMNVTLIGTCLLIAFARVTDITLDTVRTVAIIQGRRGFAAILGFFEALVYLIAVAKVLQNLGGSSTAKRQWQ